ncbi:MAG: mitochondrial fission ELM1 family protein [Kiritimatiellae bacterium]|nr:mitochondrial fission ELM1 family protein [Kiritimatiellia bacterium]
MKALILTDGKAGHENQTRAFVSALSLDADVVKIEFKNAFAKALSYLAGALPFAFTRFLYKSLPVDNSSKYKLVVGTGSGVFHAVRSLAKAFGAKSAVVLYPRGYRLSSFDCILAPAFDNPASRANIVKLPANFVNADSSFYEKGVEAFKARYTPDFRPAIAVIIGGTNSSSTMTAEWMKKSLDEIFSKHKGSQFYVTTSRRTPKDVEAVVDSMAWDYKLIFSRDKFNPIPAFVMLADVLYVTAESTGMLSEACSRGTAEVNALDNLKLGHHKFRRFLEQLTQAGYIGGKKKVDLTSSVEKAREILKL